MTAADEAVPEGSSCVAGLPWETLAASWERARWRSDALRAEALRIAEQIAVTEDAAAAMFTRMAEKRARDADRLRARSQAARDHAAWERQWIRDHSGPGDADLVSDDS